MHTPDLPHAERFPWQSAAEVWAEVALPGRVVQPEAGGRWYEMRDPDGELLAAYRPPLLLCDGAELPDPMVFPVRARDGVGCYALLLMQAGAASMGLFEGGEMREHKAFKRYVVRGKGRAQSTHLDGGKKSRYGSRLRLQNEKRLFADVNERLARWWADPVPPTRLYTACNVRLWSRLAEALPPPPLARDDPARVRIPFHVHQPSYAELLRVHRSIGRGRVWTTGEPRT